jgi:hypothetical protein
MNITINEDTITLNWNANSLNINDLLTIDNDTLIQFWFTPKADCYSELNWQTTATTTIYKTPTIPTSLNLVDGDAIWVNTYAPNLLFPSNDTAFLPTSFLIDWEDVLCPSSYHLQITTDSTLNTPEFDISNINESQYDITNLLPYQKYFWRVGQYNSNDDIYWSSFRAFTTDREDDVAYRLYPVPTSDVLNIWFETDNPNSAVITIFSNTGQILQNYTVTRVGKVIQLDLSTFIRGIYFIKYEEGTTTWVERVMVMY